MRPDVSVTKGDPFISSPLMSLTMKVHPSREPLEGMDFMTLILPYWVLTKVISTSLWGRISNSLMDSSASQYSFSKRPSVSPVSLA